MALPYDIDPELRAQLEARMLQSSAPSADPGYHPANTSGGLLGGMNAGNPDAPIPPVQSAGALAGMPAQGPNTPAGVPPKPPEPLATAPAKAVQGDFVENPGKASAWHPNMGASVTPAHATSNVSPEVRAGFEGALSEQKEAAREIGRVNQEAGTQQAATLDEMAHQLGAERFAAQERQKRRSDALEAQMADYKRLQDESASQKVNPDQWWENRSGAEKALGVIGIILGGFGGPGNNLGMKVIQDNINRDIDAQKANIAQGGKRAEAARNIYEMKMRQFGNADAADLATRAQMIEQYKLQMQSEAAATGSKMAMAQAQQAVGQLSLEQAKIHQQLETWHQTGVAGGITKEDSARAAEFVKKGYPPQQALQLAMSLRGVAPSDGLPAVAAGGKPSAEAAAAKELANTPMPAPLSVGERVEAGASHLPLIGPAFQDTSGAKKELAQDMANIAAYKAAHKGGARSPDQQEHTYGPLMYKNSDSAARRAQKDRLRKMVADGVVDSATAEGLVNHLDEGGSD